MKLHVIKDGDGNAVAAMAVGTRTPEGHLVEIRPGHEQHSLHTVEVPDELAELSADEFGQRLQAHLAAQ